MAACGSPRFFHTFQSPIFAQAHLCHGLLTRLRLLKAGQGRLVFRMNGAIRQQTGVE